MELAWARLATPVEYCGLHCWLYKTPTWLWSKGVISSVARRAGARLKLWFCLVLVVVRCAVRSWSEQVHSTWECSAYSIHAHSTTSASLTRVARRREVLVRQLVHACERWMCDVCTDVGGIYHSLLAYMHSRLNQWWTIYSPPGLKWILVPIGGTARFVVWLQISWKAALLTRPVCPHSIKKSAR